jgi:hypothetical protein
MYLSGKAKSRLGMDLALASAWLAYPCFAIAAPCSAPEPPKITLEIQRGDVRQIVDTSGDELAQLAINAGAQYHLPAYGLYTANLGYNVDIDSRIERPRDGVVCAVPISLHVTVALTNRLFHLARETQTDPCLLELTVAHLRRHAHADDEALDERAASLVDELRVATMHLSSNGAATTLAAKGELADMVSKSIDKASIGLEEFRQQLNRAIDTPAELAQLRAACRA